jgi:NADH-quinone oxidoreductase subunit L
MLTYLLIPLLPFAGFLIAGLFQRWMRDRTHWVCVPLVFASLGLSLKVFFEVMGGHTFYGDVYTWIPSGAFQASVGIMVDSLTASMLVLVTLVSSLVHLYTVGYMHGDRGYDRFFSYISLFTFSMLMLVMANNFLQLFFGWEMVGLCSYLLIVHWYDRPTATAASFKAFIQNRVGDFGFALGILLIWVTVGSVDYHTVFAAIGDHATDTISVLGFEVRLVTAIALLLFVGAVGKSAQFLLHSWLPDAMEGPTPISALIHAATMVTAGIFMVSRTHPIFNLSDTAMMAVALMGAFTAFFGATIALTQNDIKKVVAYSTMSQLGYMVMACGVGAYVAGMFHLLTHGVFKALLFLAAGSVIHALSAEQDIRKMGQVKKYMPTTYWTMLWGSLALAGIFPFAGFFSKDEILWAAWSSGGAFGKGLWLVGVVVAFMTAFYTFRVFFLVFYGKDNMTDEVRHHAHESPKVITIPLTTLAVGALLVGWLGNPMFGPNYAHEFLGPVFATETSHLPMEADAAPMPGLVGEAVAAEEHGGAAHGMEGAAGGATAAHEGGEHNKVLELALMLFSLLVAGSGIWLAYRWYYRPNEAPERVARSYGALYKGSLNKWYWDELYDAVFTRPTLRLADRLWRIADEIMIDKVMVDGVGITTRIGGEILKFFQTGRVQHYAMVMSLGIFFIVGGFFLF